MSGAVFWAAGLSVLVAIRPAVADSDKPVPGAQPKAAAESEGTYDPLEPINRVTSGFNTIFRGAVLDPLVDGYQSVTPEPVQDAVSNVVSNISEPVTVGSSLLQGDTENATTATKRFFINTTAGFGGIEDRATEMGLEQRKEDLGQAFGASGMAPGPHIVLPIIGPSNLRDVAGDAVTAVVNPLPLAAKAASSGVAYSNNREDIRSLTSGAIDPYVVERDSYEQNRDYQVNNGVVPLTAYPEFAAEDEKKSK